MTCKRCGKANDQSFSFCGSCGNALASPPVNKCSGCFRELRWKGFLCECARRSDSDLLAGSVFRHKFMVGNIWQRGDDFVLYVAFDLVHQKRVGLQRFKSDLNSGSQAAIEERYLLKLGQEAAGQHFNCGDFSYTISGRKVYEVFRENGALFTIHEDPIAAILLSGIAITAIFCLFWAFFLLCLIAPLSR